MYTSHFTVYFGKHFTIAFLVQVGITETQIETNQYPIGIKQFQIDTKQFQVGKSIFQQNKPVITMKLS